MNIVKTLLEHVTIEQLRKYLIGKGWTEEPFGREEVLKFVSPVGEWEMVIPSRREIVDYDYVTRIAVQHITEFENRPIDDVLFDILPRTLVELIELRDLLSDCERLISRHGDNFALSQSLQSLKAREHNLLEELSDDDTLGVL